MPELERPDLSSVPQAVRAYIEALETELERLRPAQGAGATPEPSEPPTTLNVITATRGGLAKRTPRHHYSRQRRGGMGVFDLDAPEADPPAMMTIADEADHLLVFTNLGRAFRLPVVALNEVPVRAKGQPLGDLLPFRPQEEVVALLPATGGTHVILASERGWVRRVHGSYLGPRLIQGTSFHDLKEGGPLAAACWSAGTDELFMASQQAQAIRFMEQQVPARGCLGMRVGLEDAVVAVTAVTPNSGVFLLSHDGKGSIRLMSGFRANKAPGASGKVALKTERLVGAVTAGDAEDLFVISAQSKIIRFAAQEVPPKEGVVQGVNCIALRSDDATAVTVSPIA